MLAGGFRLARFNVQLVGFDKAFFKGLPIPMSAITVAAFSLAFFNVAGGYPQNVEKFIIPMIFLLSYLMISRIKYDTLPKTRLKELKEKPYIILLAILAIFLLIFLTFAQALFFMFIFIILFGILRHIFFWLKKKF
jgi:CDP-diacylglycerol--serine O-phosphatidyltransferase